MGKFENDMYNKTQKHSHDTTPGGKPVIENIPKHKKIENLISHMLLRFNNQLDGINSQRR